MSEQLNLWTENYAAKALPGDDIRELKAEIDDGRVDFTQLEMSDR